MSDSKKLSVGKELTDVELMELTGGESFLNTSHMLISGNLAGQYIIKYGVLPKYTLKYGIKYYPLYGIKAY